MTAADEAEHTRTRSGMPRRRANSHGHGHGHAHHAHPDSATHPGEDEEELDAVNRLMGFLREDEV